ncbi:MAG: HDOD domain-containing protein [Pseudomonadota bacterium]
MAQQQQDMQFLFTLSTELEKNEVKLPSFPDAVIKIRDALEKDDCDIQRIAELASLETALASRLMQAANSAFYNPSGATVPDLRAAVMRLGLKEVRNMAIALAVEQLFIARENPRIADDLSMLWRRSCALSSVAYVLAAECAPGVDPEQAFLCGLLHDVGKLYMLTKKEDFPHLFVDVAERSDANGAWFPQVGKAITENWAFDETIVNSMTPLDTVSELGGAEPDLVDVVYAAELLCSASADAPMDYEVISARRLQLSETRVEEIQPAIALRMESMRQSLKG